MQFFRIAEEIIALKYHENKMRCPVHLAIGQEAVSAAFSEIVNKNDKAMSSHRASLTLFSKRGIFKLYDCRNLRKEKWMFLRQRWINAFN